MKYLRRLQTRSGFSLIELMVAISIFGILLAVGVPQFIRFRQSNNLRSAADQLRSGLRLAASTATQTPDSVRFAGAFTAASTTDDVQFQVFSVRGGQPGAIVASGTVARDIDLEAIGTVDPSTLQGSTLGAVVVFSSSRGLQAIPFFPGGRLASGSTGVSFAMKNAILELDFNVTPKGAVQDGAGANQLAQNAGIAANNPAARGGNTQHHL